MWEWRSEWGEKNQTQGINPCGLCMAYAALKGRSSTLSLTFP